MTLEQAKELHPKFYKNPANYLGIEVEYTNATTNAKGKSILDVDLLSTLLIAEELDRCVPKFKPQDGEAFIKDLEEAVKSACSYVSFRYIEDRTGDYYFSNCEEDEEREQVYEVTVNSKDLSEVTKYYRYGGLKFKTAAYVDTLRQKGYYL